MYLCRVVNSIWADLDRFCLLLVLIKFVLLWILLLVKWELKNFASENTELFERSVKSYKMM